MKKTSIIALSIVVMLVFLFGLASCLPSDNPVDDGKKNVGGVFDTHYCAYCGKCCDNTCTSGHEKCTCEALTITHTSWDILTDTSYQTTVHRYITNKSGPSIVIVGGIHGDELAGWTEALALVDEESDSYIGKMYGVCGNILIIPQANICADNAKKRYVSGTSDLNRSFPIGRYSSAKALMIQVSTAIVDTIETFMTDYGADYIIDLHESRHSWTEQDSESTTLGDTLIYDNEVFTMESIIDNYNNYYRQEGETTFSSMPASQDGSFSKYFTNTYPEKVVFTIETNRGNYGLGDTIALSTRVRQQHNMLSSMFDIAWGRVDVE